MWNFADYQLRSKTDVEQFHQATAKQHRYLWPQSARYYIPNPTGTQTRVPRDRFLNALRSLVADPPTHYVHVDIRHICGSPTEIHCEVAPRDPNAPAPMS